MKQSHLHLHLHLHPPLYIYLYNTTLLLWSSQPNLLFLQQMTSSLSQGLVFTTAMLVSSTMLYLVFSRQKITPIFQIHVSQDSNTQFLRSCLYSDEKKRERKMNTKKNKKKVRFEESVKEVREKSEVARKEKQRKRNRVYGNCRNNDTTKIRGIPANRIALYNGILRDRVHRI